MGLLVCGVNTMAFRPIGRTGAHGRTDAASPQHARTRGPGEPPASVAVRRFLLAHGVREHNHASEIARIIDVDRSQSYRRLKGDVAWSHSDLRAIARHFGAQEDQLLPQEEAGAPRPGAAAQDSARHHPHPRAAAHGPAGRGRGTRPPDDTERPGRPRSRPLGWEIYVNGDEPLGARRHAIESLTLRSHPHLQVALLEDDTRAAAALVEAFRPLGIVATPYADAARCSRRSRAAASMRSSSTGCRATARRAGWWRRSARTARTCR